MAEANGLLLLAKEALKPASSVVDALIGPKLTQIKTWSLDKNLRTRVKQSLLEDVSDKYLRRLLKRVSGISSLVFQHKAVPLPEVYEPLMLEDVTKSISRKSPRRPRKTPSVPWMRLTRPGARSFIVDGAGMGKSTFVKHLCMQELESSDRIPIFIELRRIGPGQPLVEALANDFDDLHRIFDRGLFLSLLSVGRFLILLDGLDEVSVDLRENICAQIEDLAVKADSAAILVTSRPEVPLPSMAGAKFYQFLPLNASQAVSLVEKFDAFAGVDVGARLMSRMHELPQHFLEKPILVALLYISFGHNGEIAPSESAFYDELYSALYKGHDLSKGGFARTKMSALEFSEFRRLTRGFAILLVVDPPQGMLSEKGAVTYVERAIELTGVRPKSASDFIDDLLLAVPLLMRDGSELRFSHRTIGEYFAADFLANSPQGADFIRAIVSSGKYQQYSEVMYFLRSLSPQLFRCEIIAPSLERFLKLCMAEADEILLSAKFTMSGFAIELGGDYDFDKFSSNAIVGVLEPDGDDARHLAIDLESDVPFLDLFIRQISRPVQGAMLGLKFKSFAGLPNGHRYTLDELIRLGGDELDALKCMIPDLISISTEKPGRNGGGEEKPILISKEKVELLLREIRGEHLQSQALRGLISGL